MKLRDYQQRMVDRLFTWWGQNLGEDKIPLLVSPTASGKSVIIASAVDKLFKDFPQAHPRTLVIVPSKELCEQNAEKLRAVLPKHISVGFYSASLGKKQKDADVIVCTIKSIYKIAKKLGNIKCVVIDEAHLVNSDGAGSYRQFLQELAQLCTYRCVGLTATPFRGNGVWLTQGDDPLFTDIAVSIPMQELIDAGYLSPLVRPSDVIKTKIDTEGISTTSGDYKLDDLSIRVESYLDEIAIEVNRLAVDRRKWIAFCPTVINANHFAESLRQLGHTVEVVTGDTNKHLRAQYIADFRAGKIRCLVTVLALTTGFDVPDVDCLIWMRPTKSLVLYVQGVGRGMRIADEKEDCLWLDFSHTTEELGAVDAVRGRNKRARRDDDERKLPSCPNCGANRPIGAMECVSCGFVFPVPEKEEITEASNAAIMSSQIEKRYTTHEVTHWVFRVHKKPGSPDSLRVDYYAGMLPVVSEWVFFDHAGYARTKAEKWWEDHEHNHPGKWYPASVKQAMENSNFLTCPSMIKTTKDGKYDRIVDRSWETANEQAEI